MNRIATRTNMTCAPLKTEGYTLRKNNNSNCRQSDTLEYYYGGQDKGSSHNLSTSVTYEYPIYAQTLGNKNVDFTIG